ncbi:MAG: hypothetical protein VYD57_03370, partial [Pseudomonadota bacterium]|nr:hypothetical protein [Pseudomonadota bacterium]
SLETGSQTNPSLNPKRNQDPNQSEKPGRQNAAHVSLSFSLYSIVKDHTASAVPGSSIARLPRLKTC